MWDVGGRFFPGTRVTKRPSQKKCPYSACAEYGRRVHQLAISCCICSERHGGAFSPEYSRLLIPPFRYRLPRFRPILAWQRGG